VNGSDGYPKLSIFDAAAERYDRWFSANASVFESELRLLVHLPPVRPEGRALSIGCGGGIFEEELRWRGISIGQCVEPSELDVFATRRGLKVTMGFAEALPCGEVDAVFIDTLLGYVRDS